MEKLKFDVRKMLKILWIVLNYSVRIAAAVLILWWCMLRIGEWKDFQVFREWNQVYEFEGNGTYEDPYLISSADDLIKFSEAVNNGNYFFGMYFKQIDDIDMSECDNFIPIGCMDSGYMFRGIYDGGGHTISNLIINANSLDSKFVGLFGKLGGVVMNLGIESGRISGDYVGSIAAADGSTDAMIINCYNKADLYAIVRCGGIADNFSVGRILGCANYGHLSGNVTCQIVSYNCSIICGCCNVQTSHDYIVPYDTFAGSVYDCFIGTTDRTELNDYIDVYQDFIIYPDDPVFDIIPWQPQDD